MLLHEACGGANPDRVARERTRRLQRSALARLYHWKKQYARGKLNNEPTEEAALERSNEPIGADARQAYLGERVFKKGLAEHPQGTERKREFIGLYQASKSSKIPEITPDFFP